MSTVPKVGPSLLLGRDDEVALVEQVVDAVRAGVGGCVYFIGEAGAGKTALIRHAQARAAGLTVLVSQGLEGEADLPYAGLHRLLQPVAARSDELIDAGDAATLTAALRLPPRSTTDSAATDRPAVAAATLRLLHALAAQRPVLMTVDNADRLDERTRQVLSFLIGRTGQAAIALIVAARDDEVALALPNAQTQHLSGLDEPAVAELLAAVGAVPTAAAVRSFLTTATRGNPRALTELAGLLTADQLRGVEMLPDPVPLGPATAWAYAGPIHRLPTETRRVLLLAATDPGLDAATLGRAAAELGTDLDALLPAEDAGLATVDISGVSFTHPLVRSGAYYAAAASARRQAHEVIARVCPDRATTHRAAIARELSEELAAELLGVADRIRSTEGHTAAAGPMQRSAELTPPGPARSHRFHVAATDAWLGGDTARAIALLDHSSTGADPGDEVARAKVDLLRGQIMLRCGNVIDAYETLMATAMRFESHNVQLATRAHVGAGMAAWVAGDLGRFRQAAKRAKASVGDRVAELPPAVRLGLDYLTGLAAQFVGRLDEAVGPLRSVVDAALSVEDPSALVLAAACGLVGGDRPLVHALATRGLNAARDSGATAVIPHAIEILTLAECWTGRYPLADPHAFEGLRVARQTGQSNSEGHLLSMLAVGAAINGHTDECYDYARAADKIARKHSLGLVIATADWAIAMLDVVYARWTPAYQRLGRLFRAAPGVGHPVVALNCAPYFVEAAAIVGRPTKGQKILDMYEQWAGMSNRAGMLAIAARCRAVLAEPPDADGHYREAIQHHQRSDRDFERAYTELLFGRYLRRNRQRAEARDTLHSAHEVFERLELTLWTQRVRAELRAVGERDDTVPDTNNGVLTAQQLQIARLIAEGATNREVAERIFVSPRTVDYHLRNIFQRLAINSRAELIRRFG